MEKKWLSPPPTGSLVRHGDGALSVPDDPIIPYIEGDGVGVDVSPAMMRVLDAGVSLAYGGARSLRWWQLAAGELAHGKFGEWLPADTVEAIRTHRVAIKGPMTTPVGEGIRSLNVTLRQELDLFACVRPAAWVEGVPSPLKDPSRVSVVIFRENTEDTYMGVEFPAGSDEARRLAALVAEVHGASLSADSGIGVKPISKRATERIAGAAMDYALARGLPSVTIVHKGNIMKFTEGAFRRWAYDLYLREYREKVVTEEELGRGESARGRVVVKDRIADAMFHDLTVRPEEYDVLVTPNLTGDYLSDAAAGLRGGLGVAPGANLGDGIGLFEAVHGTAPALAGQDKANPSSLILSGCMMLEYLGWDEAAVLVRNAFATTVGKGDVTVDLAAQIEGGVELSCSAFAKAVIDNMAS